MLPIVPFYPDTRPTCNLINFTSEDPILWHYAEQPFIAYSYNCRKNLPNHTMDILIIVVRTYQIKQWIFLYL